MLGPLFATATSCGRGPFGGYGPPEHAASIGDYATPPDHDLTVALRSFSVDRPARGLNAFPDGGIAISLDGGVEVNVCTAATRRFEQVAVIHEPPDRVAKSASTPLIIAWQDTAVRVTRYSGGDAVVRLPPGVQVGSAIRDRFRRDVVPACAASLDSLRNSTLMPDGTPVTDDRP